jgi:anti-sigma factor RsiW
MTDYIDGRLEPGDRNRLEAHLGACPHCSEYLAQLRVTVDALGDAEPADLSDDALTAFVDLYREWSASP